MRVAEDAGFVAETTETFEEKMMPAIGGRLGTGVGGTVGRGLGSNVG